MARQAANEAGKLLQLEIVGGSIELDRGMLDRLTPAFEHLLRNAAIHGIESPADRIAAGKPEIGSVQLQLHQHGNQISIELRDDGAGLDLVRIRERAFALGWNWIEGQESELIFSPGFSTAGTLTELGRPRGRTRRGAQRGARGRRADRGREQRRQRLLLHARAAADHRDDAGADAALR